MTTDNTLPWIRAGYEIFSKEGPKGLKIEVIARKVGKSKSSFYHHFVDLEIFTDFLLKYHLERAEAIAILEAQCKNIDPEMIAVLVQVKTDLLFNRQLRVHRDNPNFRQVFEASNKMVSEAFLPVWAKDLGLEGHPLLASDYFKLALENFYLQITEETLNHEWLRGYFQELRQMAGRFKGSSTSSPSTSGK